METRSRIRRQMRQRRNALTPEQQQQAAARLAQHLPPLLQQHHYRHIALYYATDGELDTAPLIHALWQQGIKTYLPTLHPFCAGHLLFLHYDAHTPMGKNRFGIAEPQLDVRQVQPVHQLDAILTPLVAFDTHGNRLGMGGGFYDRTLGAENAPPAMGLAHSCQQVEALPIADWDMPLHAIITPDMVHLCR